MTGIDYLPLLFSGEEQIFMLSDHQIAQLLRAMFAYSRAYAQGGSPEIEIDDPMVNIVFVGLFGAVRECRKSVKRCITATSVPLKFW